MATNISAAERRLGLDSVVSFTDGGEGRPLPDTVFAKREECFDADIHVSHSYIPDEAKGKWVFVAHGTPEHCIHMAMEGKANWSSGDPFMLSMNALNRSDVTVTFWQRHRDLLQTWCPKARIETVPMGVDREFWLNGLTRGKYAGEPSFFCAENFHAIKWPLDLMLAWPFVMAHTKKAIFHWHYIPHDLHRFIYPLLYANGAAFKSFSSSSYFLSEELRNCFKSVDFYVSPVRCGDYNTISLEAKAAGCKVISYRGNPYADYWMMEGDQREIADSLINIINGMVEPREPSEVPDISETAEAMKVIYESL